MPDLPACPCGVSDWNSALGFISRHRSRCFFSCGKCRRHGLYLTWKCKREVAVFLTSGCDGDDVDREYVERELLGQIEAYANDSENDSMFFPATIPLGQIVFVRVEDQHWIQLSDDQVDPGLPKSSPLHIVEPEC